MPTLPTLGAFAAAVVVLILIPGPAVFYIMNRGISQGRKAAVVSALGIETGALVHIVAAVAGLSAVIASSEGLFLAVKYAGAAYLVWLGILAWRSGDHDEAGLSVVPAPLRRVFTQGIVVNILNPKVSIFFLALLPQFISPAQGAAWLQMLALGAVFLTIATVLDVSYALASGTVGEWLSRRGGLAKLRNRVSAAAYLSLGAVVGLRG
jgi:threonine/homoserine/homoserine lactone efflux protein